MVELMIGRFGDVHGRAFQDGAEGLDEVVRLGAPGRSDHLPVIGIGPAIEQVVAHRAVQQRGVLGHHADLPAQRILRHGSNVLSNHIRTGWGL